MANEYKLSLPAAVVINLNIMLGTGIFLNSIPLAQFAGAWGFAPYIIVSILLVPLILAMAQLLKCYEESSFYDIGNKSLGPFWGFISAWCYFIAKPASAALMIHFFSFLAQKLLVPLASIPLFVLDTIIITMFVIFNLLNMRIGKSILVSFLCLKSIPIVLITLVGLMRFAPQLFNFATINFSGIVLGLPLALFACSGFEATLSLSRQIQNSQRNAPRAVIISYVIAVSVYLFYQLAYYAGIDQTLMSLIPSFDGIAFFLQSVGFRSESLRLLLYFCMGVSALGGAYGILFSNAWNLHALADNRHVVYCDSFVQKNRAGIAYWCLFVEAFLCIAYLLGTGAQQITLQQISVLGSTLAYTVSMCAFSALAWRVFKTAHTKLIAVLALINCALFIMFCVNGFLKNGPHALIIFILLCLVGSVMYRMVHKPKMCPWC